MALDELYDAGLCHFVAADHIANRQLDYELHDHPATEEDVRAFCERLRAAGFLPDLVVTDGSKLYPPVIAGVGPQAEHQRCTLSAWGHLRMAVWRWRSQNRARAAARDAE